MSKPPFRARLGDRSLFPDLGARSYLAHAAISPASLAVSKRVNAVLRDYAVGGMEGLRRWLPMRDRLKSKLATLIGAAPDEIGFVQSTTPGVVQVAHSLPWRSGDRVLLFEGEFPANVTPWQRVAQEFDLAIDFVPIAPFLEDLDEGLTHLEDRLRRGARLVAVSAVQFQTGLRMPLPAIAALCRRHGAELFVDAIQQLGAVPLSVACGVDYLVAGGHKWLMGMEGAGFVYVQRERARCLVPRMAGWLGHTEALRFLFDGAGHLRTDRPFLREAALVEQGAQSNLSLAALEAGLDLILELGVEAVFDHVQAWHDALEPALVARGYRSARAGDPRGRSGSLCVRPPPSGDLQRIHQRLLDAGIEASTPDGWLRFAPHWPNAIEETAWVLEAI